MLTNQTCRATMECHQLFVSQVAMATGTAHSGATGDRLRFHVSMCRRHHVIAAVIAQTAQAKDYFNSNPLSQTPSFLNTLITKHNTCPFTYVSGSYSV